MTVALDGSHTPTEKSKHRQQPSWIGHTLPCAANVDSWPPHNPLVTFDWSSPTCQFYAAATFSTTVTIESGHDQREESKEEANELLFSPSFQQARSRLDYSYHTNLVLNRQYLQDAILQRVVQKCLQSSCQQRPWIIFTAGAMGVGKGYVLTQLQAHGLLDVSSLVPIDPDLIKTELPEMAGYLQHDRLTAATLLHRESTQMADVLFEHCLAHQYPILVDGSLRDVEYYQSLLQRLRTEYPWYRLAILHVTAEPNVILQRAESRAQRTGRVVPYELLEASMVQVPQSVAALSSLVHVVYTVANNEGRPLELVSTLRHGTSSMDCTWEDFAQSWHDDQPANERIPINSSTTDHSVASINSCDVGNAAAVRNDSGTCALPIARKVLPIVDMVQAVTCTISHAVAQAIWQGSYPNVCPRCTISCDFAVCGICIHGCHECACTVCHAKPSCRLALANVMTGTEL